MSLASWGFRVVLIRSSYDHFFCVSVNVYHCIGQEERNVVESERSKQEREFRIGSIGLADSFGVLTASLLAVPTEVELCKAQIRRGKTICRGL